MFLFVFVVKIVDSVDRLWTDNVFAAHVHSQRFWNANGAVVVQVVFQECDEHTWRSNNGVVQGVSEVVSAFAFDADTQSASLSVAQVGAGTNFEVFLLTWRPSFYVDGFYFQVSQVTGAAFQGTNRDVQGAEELNGVVVHFFEPFWGFFRFAHNNHFRFSNWWMR